jgi:hypothetical protein
VVKDMSHGRSEIKKFARREKEIWGRGRWMWTGRRLIGGLDREVETEAEACGGLYVGPWAASFRKGLLVLERSSAYKEIGIKRWE